MGTTFKVEWPYASCWMKRSFDTKTQCNVVLDKVRSSLNSNAVILSSGCYKK